MGWLLTVAGTAGVASNRAQAQQDARNSPAYKDLIRKALEEYELGNYAEAKVFFADAHALYPNARTLRGLGLCAYGQRDYVAAIRFFDEALANPVQPLSPDLQSSIAEYLQQAQRFVGRLRLRLEPRNANIRVDEQPVERQTDGTLQLNPGLHELTLSAPGYETVSRRWNVEAGARGELSIQLRPEPGALPAPQPLAAKPEPNAAPFSTRSAESPSSIGPWILVGVSGATAIAGGVLLGMTLSDIGTVEDARVGTDWREVESAYERTPTVSTVGFVLLGAGLAGVTVGLAWAFWPSEKATSAQTAELRVGPGALQLRAAF